MKTLMKLQRILFIGIFSFISIIPISGQKVYISQVLYDSPLSEENDMHNGEFIELYNPSDKPMNLCRWSLSGYFPKEIYTFKDIVFPAQSYLIVAYRFWKAPVGSQFMLSSLFPELLEYEFSDKIQYHHTIRLSNGGETILLKDSNGDIVDQIQYYGRGNSISAPTLQKGQKQLYAYNGRRSYSDGYKCRSLLRKNVARDQYGNAVFRIDDWDSDVARPLGIKLYTPGSESFNSSTEEDVKYFPKYDYANAIDVVIPNIGDQPPILRSDGDILYSYDVNGNRIERIIYLSKVKKATVKADVTEETLFSDNNNQEIIHIYPNPTKGQLFLKIKSSVEFDSGKIHLFDNSGKLIISDQVTSYSHSIDLRNYSSGVYLLKVLINKEVYVWKIIKE